VKGITDMRMSKGAFLLLGAGAVLLFAGVRLSALYLYPEDKTLPRGPLPIPSSHVAAAPGLIEPLNEEREVAAEANGIINEMRIEENEEVNLGQILAVLDNAEQVARLESAQAELALREAELDRTLNGARPEERREARAALSEAQAGLDFSRREYDRRLPLVKSGVSPKAALDKALSDLNASKARATEMAEKLSAIETGARKEDVAAARAQVKLAKANVALATALLNKTYIRSPIAGVVLRRMRLPGESVSSTPPTPIALVGNLNGLQVRAEVDETDAAKIKVGQRVEIVADAYPNKKFPGIVSRIASRMGAKQIQPGRPTDKLDAKILQVFIRLDPNVKTPIGLRVDAYFLAEPAAAPEPVPPATVPPQAASEPVEPASPSSSQ
jgi:HlyD family secretion protein